MNSLRPTTVQYRYPIRYWFAIVFATTIPCFVKFDTTGKTHDVGTFNPWTLTTIALNLASCAMLVFLTLLSRRKLLVRKVNYISGLWMALLIILAFASLLTPNFPGQPVAPSSSMLISFYRLQEWVVAFALILTVYTRETPANSHALLVKMIYMVCFLNIAAVWLVLPISPSLAFTGADDFTGAAQPRLGGFMITPSHLGLVCGIAFFYFVIFKRGATRIVACVFLVGSLFLTYARGALLGFLIVLLLYIVLYMRSTVIRTVSALVLCIVTGGALTFSEQALHFLSRGHDTNNITTLSDRTLVWQAAWKCFQDRPLIGYGFVQGVKGALKEHWTYSYWVPPHCHNDLIQAAVSGGIIAALCLFAIYVHVMWHAFRLAKTSPEHLFYLLTLLQLCIAAFLGPMISSQYGQCGAIFYMCMLGVLNNNQAPETYRPVPQRKSMKLVEVTS
jgi:O-antigen ligase